MKKYKFAVFDLDGTLLDTLQDLADAVNYALVSCGFPKRTLEEVRCFVGNGVKNLIERAIPTSSDESDFERVFSQFKLYYSAHSLDKTKPYDGITELISQLESKGVRTAVVSNKLDSAVKVLCREFFPGVTCAIGEREGISRKPSPDSVFAAMQQIGASSQDTLYIGDSEVDVVTAANAGIDCASVLWGFRDRQTLEEYGAKLFISSPEQLLELF